MSNLIKLKQIKGGTALQADVTKAKSDITTLTTDLDKAEGKITTLEGSVADLQAAVGAEGSVAAQIEAAVTAAEDNCYVVEKTSAHADDMAAIATLFTEENGKKPAKGDTCVVKALIAADKYAHTGYVFDGEWKAMDGNYSADNVFFSNNLIITTDVGVQTIPASGSKTLETTGKSVKQVMDMLFASEKNPSTTQPDVSFSASGASGEVGTTFTLPTATLKMTGIGSYTYGPATGVTIPVGEATVSQDGTENKESNAAAMVKDSTVILTATGANVYTDSAIDFKFSAIAVSTDGTVPVTNLGNNYAAGQIKSKTFEKTTTATFTGFRAWFYGGDAKSTLDSATIRSTSMTNKGDFVAGDYEVKAASYSGCTRIIVAIPSALNKSVKQVLLKSASNADITSEFKLQGSTVEVEGANGYATTKPYKVWVYEPASLDASEVYTITVG